MSRITAASLQAGLRAWAQEDSATRTALERALQIVNRDLPGAHTLEDLSASLLLALARRHEGHVEGALHELAPAMARLLDDVDTMRTVSSRGRAPELREKDLHAVANGLAAMASFEGRVQDMVDKDPGSVQALMRRIMAGEQEVPATAAVGAEARTLTQSRSLGDQMVGEAEEIFRAWRAGHTAEPRPVPIPWSTHPELVAAMHRMEDAVVRYRAAAGSVTDPAAAEQAVRKLRQTVSDTREVTRSFARRFDSGPATDRMPPVRPLRPGPNQAGSAAADALAARARVGALTPQASAVEVVDALHFDDLKVTSTGALGEGIDRTVPGMNQNVHVLSGSGIRRLRTDPPWLASRLADIVKRWQRAHVAGPGFGGELFSGIMLAPWGVNQLAQNKGIENILRGLARASSRSGGPEISPVITATGRRLAVPLATGAFENVDVLSSVRYELPRPGQATLHVEITVQLDGSWKVTHDLPPGTWPPGVPLSGNR